MISRYLVIALAFIAAGFRASQGAWLEATGLAGLGAGLTVLKLAERRPALKPLAYLGFLVDDVLDRGRVDPAVPTDGESRQGGGRDRGRAARLAGGRSGAA